MPSETINLYLVGLQTLAALIAAGAALAMWKSTVNLVNVTRDMLLANVAPEVVIRLEHPHPFKSKEKATMRIENRGSVDLIDVRLAIGCIFSSDDEKSTQSEMHKYRIGKLKSGYSHRSSLWDNAKTAVQKQKSLGDAYRKARDASNA